MKTAIISKFLTLLQQPVTELLGYQRDKSKAQVTRLVDDVEDTVSRVQRVKARRQKAALWQGLAPSIESVEEEIQYSALTESCLDFNGDFYGLREQAPGQHVFFLGDVSGKGLATAFYQTSCLTLLQQSSRICQNAVEVVHELNAILSEREDEERFATLLYGIFDSKNYTVTLVNAGHPMPFLLSADGEVRETECPLGLPVGLSSKFSYHSKTFTVQPGDTLVLYSDGLIEARNETRDFLGQLGLLGLLMRYYTLPLPELTKRVMSDIDRFSLKRSDDQTIMALRFGTPAKLERAHIDADSSTDDLNSQILACA